MPQIKCPNCGRTRLVVDGKHKKCRKCGTALTTNPPVISEVESPDIVTIGQLKEMYPEQIRQIVQEALSGLEIDLDVMDEPQLRKFAANYGIEISGDVQDIEQLRAVIADALQAEPPAPQLDVDLDAMDIAQLRAFAAEKQIIIPLTYLKEKSIRKFIKAELEKRQNNEE